MSQRCEKTLKIIADEYKLSSLNGVLFLEGSINFITEELNSLNYPVCPSHDWKQSGSKDYGICVFKKPTIARSCINGHNHPYLQEALHSYLANHGIVMSLDMETQSKNEFMAIFYEHILHPRGLDYRLQFPGHTGANSVEAAIKLARKVTGRPNVIAFTNAFHGCSLGALALTANEHHRGSSEALLTHVNRVPYDGYLWPDVDVGSA